MAKAKRTTASTEKFIQPGAIYQGDCVELLPRIKPASIGLVVLDPPYNIGWDYDVHDDRMPPKEYEIWCINWMLGIKQALKPNGSFWLIIGDEWAADLKVAATRMVGFHLRNWVIQHHTFGQQVKSKFVNSHVHCFHFVMDKKNHVFNFDAVRVPSARQMVYNDKRAKAGGKCPDDVWILRPQWFPEGFQATDNTWYIPRVNGTFKEKLDTPNQLPEQLVARMIAATSVPGDVVLDCMAGSGTVPCVAKKMNRIPLGLELSPKYAAAAARRLKRTFVGQAIQ